MTIGATLERKALIAALFARGIRSGGARYWRPTHAQSFCANWPVQTGLRSYLCCVWTNLDEFVQLRKSLCNFEKF